LLPEGSEDSRSLLPGVSVVLEYCRLLFLRPQDPALDQRFSGCNLVLSRLCSDPLYLSEPKPRPAQFNGGLGRAVGCAHSLDRLPAPRARPECDFCVSRLPRLLHRCFPVAGSAETMARWPVSYLGSSTAPRFVASAERMSTALSD